MNIAGKCLFEERAITLIELMIVIGLLAIIISIISSITSIYAKYINADIERYNIHSQIDYALQDIKTRCASAIQIDSQSAFSPGSEEKKTAFTFWGERDIYNITPDNLTDNVRYTYSVDSATHDLLLQTQDPNNPSQNPEILVEGKYKPQIEFSHEIGNEPNFLTVKIKAISGKATAGISKIISKLEGVRFWFADIMR